MKYKIKQIKCVQLIIIICENIQIFILVYDSTTLILKLFLQFNKVLNLTKYKSWRSNV